MSDIGFDELSIHATVNPIRGLVKSGNASFAAGDAVALAWLERKNGAWLQSSPERFCCRNYLLHQLAELRVDPNGYGDKGKIIM
ncbi:MAG: hypothetical protein H5U29_09445 [Pusillimonas sp.]|nr:hypothetical protein [Pusillimonas sp.]